MLGRFSLCVPMRHSLIFSKAGKPAEAFDYFSSFQTSYNRVSATAPPQIKSFSLHYPEISFLEPQQVTPDTPVSFKKPKNGEINLHVGHAGYGQGHGRMGLRGKQLWNLKLRLLRFITHGLCPVTSQSRSSCVRFRGYYRRLFRPGKAKRPANAQSFACSRFI